MVGNTCWTDTNSGQKNASSDMVNTLFIAGTTWKCSGIAEQLHVDCSC